MIPARFAPMRFGLVLSGPMSWLIAFPTVLVAAPPARPVVSRMVG